MADPTVRPEQPAAPRFSLPQVQPAVDVAARVAAVEEKLAQGSSGGSTAALAAEGDASARPDLHAAVVGALRGVFDPELPVNIYDLGLIYDVAIAPEGLVKIRMTLTAPACPVAGSMPGMVERAVKKVPGVHDAKVELVWDPPWTRERMSDVALLQLGLL